MYEEGRNNKFISFKANDFGVIPTLFIVVLSTFSDNLPLSFESFYLTLFYESPKEKVLSLLNH